MTVRFLRLLYGPEGAGPAVATPEFGQMLADYQAAMQAMARPGCWSIVARCSQ
jgi:hypothetical protein